MIQLLVVAGVAACIYLFMRSKRLARDKWLARVDLPGLWHWREGNATLTLIGRMDRGTFVASAIEADETERSIKGDWQLEGHTLNLNAPDYHQVLELTLYKLGSIGLEDEEGVRRTYLKETTNVVPLRRH